MIMDALKSKRSPSNWKIEFFSGLRPNVIAYKSFITVEDNPVLPKKSQVGSLLIVKNQMFYDAALLFEFRKGDAGIFGAIFR